MSMSHPLNVMSEAAARGNPSLFPTAFNGRQVQYYPGSAGAMATGQDGRAGGAGGSAQPSGRGATFTPDPSVNGPWTHTRADIPLFRSAPAAAPSQPSGPTSPQQPVSPAPKMPSMPRPAMPQQPQRPQMMQPPPQRGQQMQQPGWGSFSPMSRPAWSMASATQMPKRKSYSDMLADALSGR